MEAQVFKAVHLVINVGVPDEVPSGVVVVFQHQIGHRVVGGQRILCFRIGGVVERTAILCPCEIATKVRSVWACGVINGLRRIHSHGGIHRIFICKTILGKHAFCIEIKRQVVVEQMGIEIECGRIALETRGFHDALLIGVAHRHTPGQIAFRCA